jgi:hypothetical protein
VQRCCTSGRVVCWVCASTVPRWLEALFVLLPRHARTHLPCVPVSILVAPVTLHSHKAKLVAQACVCCVRPALRRLLRACGGNSRQQRVLRGCASRGLCSIVSDVTSLALLLGDCLAAVLARNAHCVVHGSCCSPECARGLPPTQHASATLMSQALVSPSDA